MKHPCTIEWEEKLTALLAEIDAILERRFGNLYPLHPARPERGATSSERQDGLFQIVAKFTAGFGSEHGSGYIIDLDIVTLADVPEADRRRFEDLVVDELRKRLPTAFPGRDLRVERDGAMYKVFGDLSLGTA